MEFKLNKELKEFKEKVKEKPVIGALVNLAKTLDQAKTLLTFLETLTEKNFRYAIALTASRGRVFLVFPT